MSELTRHTISAAAEKVLTAANTRFLDYMRDRHHTTEESVLRDVSGHTPAGALIRAVAEWRIAQRHSSDEENSHG